MKNDFFGEQREQSLVKTTIISKYFWVWAKVIISTVKKKLDGKIAYIDLFAGPGRYEIGTASTPLLVLKQAINDDDMRKFLVAIFNDKDEANARALEVAIEELPGIETLSHKPIVYNHEIGTEIIKQFEQMRLVPTLLFVDPWGYKGLSLRLVDSVLKDWGCDCIFFFNYNRINMGINNKLVEEHMNALFGQKRADKLRLKLSRLDPRERELTIVEELSQALQSHGERFVLPFRFRNHSGNRTSHHLIFVTKHFRGYEIMKDIMAKMSSGMEQGVPTFEYSPALESQPLLFELSRPIDELENLLLDKYAGKTLSMRQIYRDHNVGRRYISKNYKDVLLKMESVGKIQANPSKRRRGTFADKVLVTFPEK